MERYVYVITTEDGSNLYWNDWLGRWIKNINDATNFDATAWPPLTGVGVDVLILGKD